VRKNTTRPFKTPPSACGGHGRSVGRRRITTVEDVAHFVPGLSPCARPDRVNTEYEARGLASNGGAHRRWGSISTKYRCRHRRLAQVGKVVIDPDLYDVNRIEVFTRPQGTLYGSGSMAAHQDRDNQPSSIPGKAPSKEAVGHRRRQWQRRRPASSKYSDRRDPRAARRRNVHPIAAAGSTECAEIRFPRTPASAAAMCSRRGASRHTQCQHGRSVWRAASLLFQPSSDVSVVATALYQRMVMGGYDDFDSPPAPLISRITRHSTSPNRSPTPCISTASRQR